jgi:uncharacterized membrane protein YoaK (UPF0700 family)
MTGNTIQVMLDLADLTRRLSPEARTTTKARLRRMSTSVAAFAVGCATAALLYAFHGDRCFLVPPMVGLYTLCLRESAPVPA